MSVLFGYTFTIPETELYNDDAEEFINVQETTITIIHSLISLSKWESKWHVPFLNNRDLTREQFIDYVRCMTVLPTNVDPRIYYALTDADVDKILAYLEDPMCATKFEQEKLPEGAGRPKYGKPISSEKIYSLLAACGISFESVEKWHVNRVLALLKNCGDNNAPKKKMSGKERKAKIEANRNYFKSKLGGHKVHG